MTSGVVQSGRDLRRGPWHRGLEAQASQALLSPAPRLAAAQVSPPWGLSPSRRTPYKAMFCRISNRDGMGSFLAKFRVDPR